MKSEYQNSPLQHRFDLLFFYAPITIAIDRQESLAAQGEIVLRGNRQQRQQLPNSDINPPITRNKK
jgi:hypothetical protein